MTTPQRTSQLFETQPPADVGLYICHCGFQHCAGGQGWGPGIRDHFSLHFVRAGAGHVALNGTGHTATSGDLFLAAPGSRLHHAAGQDDPWAYYWVAFGGPQAAVLADRLPFTAETPLYRTTRPEAVESALRHLCDAHGPHPHQTAKSTGLLLVLAALLMEETTAEGAAAKNEAALEHALRFIHLNYAHDIGVDDMAKAAGLSRSHLYRLFMAACGCSPIAYLTTWRIQKACALIEQAQLSMQEVACSVGFSDQFYFSRVFKKAVGVPPSRYQKNAPGI